MSEQDQRGTLTSPKVQRLFVFLCWITYFSTYLGRLDFTASLAEISAAEGFSKSALGMVSSGFFLGYGVFQLIWGFVGDRMNPIRMVFCGILGSGLLNLLVSFCRTVEPMVVLWTLNGMVQAAVWSPLLRLTLERLPVEQATKASVGYATTVPLGTFAAYLLAAGCAVFGSWRTDFRLSGLFLTAIALVWYIAMGKLLPREAAVSQVPTAGQQTQGGIPGVVWRLLVPICLATMVNGLIRDSVQTWMPTYLSERHGLDGASSIFLTMALPVVNLSGVYVGTFFNRRLFDNEVLTAGVSFLLAALLLTPMLLGLSLSYWTALVLFGLCAAMMLAVNTMFVTLVPVQLQFTRRTSTLSGILNSATYLGSTISGYGVGRLLEQSDWGQVLRFWVLGLLAAAFLSIVLFRFWARQRGRSA